MSNNYHLVVRTPSANLVAGMTWFQDMVTGRLNLGSKDANTAASQLLLKDFEVRDQAPHVTLGLRVMRSWLFLSRYHRQPL